jgi:hypothetical protein
MSIRVPRYTKSEQMVIHFKTTKERRLDDVVAAVNELYDGEPLPARVIGERCGLSNHWTWIYLHQSKDAGRVNAVLRANESIVGGWVPAHVDASLTLADLAAHRAADTLRKLYSGKPAHASEIGRQLGVTPTTAIRWMQRAATLGLVQCSNSGWEPV